MFFGTWHDLLRVVVFGALAYAGIITVLRISGKRTLAKMSAFDFVVSVALGSVLATTLLSKDVALLEGVLAFALLALLQFIVAQASLRWRWTENLAKSTPRLLLADGVIDDAALQDERVTRDELLAAVRLGGFGDLDSIGAVVLETNGRFSVIPQAHLASGSALPRAPTIARAP